MWPPLCIFSTFFYVTLWFTGFFHSVSVCKASIFATSSQTSYQNQYDANGKINRARENLSERESKKKSRKEKSISSPRTNYSAGENALFSCKKIIFHQFEHKQFAVHTLFIQIP